MNIFKWEIWLANLEPVVGSEQGKTRPVLIISENYTNQLLNIVNVIPVTTRKNNRQVYPNEVLLLPDNLGLPNESIALCYQIRTIDKKRLIKRYGSINNETQKEEIVQAIKFQLGI